MLDYSTLFSAASQLPVTDRMRLIDALAATLPKNEAAAPVSSNHDELAYADALSYLREHREEIKQALQRRGGVTTPELLQKAAAAAATRSAQQ